MTPAFRSGLLVEAAVLFTDIDDAVVVAAALVDAAAAVDDDDVVDATAVVADDDEGIDSLPAHLHLQARQRQSCCLLCNGGVYV